MKKPTRFWKVLGPDREVLLYVNITACGYEAPIDAIANLGLDDCFVGLASVEIKEG